jgi:hypothetical protein
MKSVEIKVLTIDFLSTLHILRSVAAAQVISQSTKYGWKPTDLIASANLWGEVGMWEAQVPNGPTLRKDIQIATRHRAEQMLLVAQQGPAALVRWLNGQTSVRDQCLRNYFDQVAAMNKINKATLNALNASVYAIKTARFVANAGLIVGSVAFALYGMGYAVSAGVAGATGLAGTATAGTATAATSATAGVYGGVGTAIAMPLVGLTKSLSYVLIKEWNNATEAKVLGFAFETDKVLFNEGMGAKGSESLAASEAWMAKAGLVGAMSTAADEDLIILRESHKKAVELAEKNVADAQRKLKHIESRKGFRPKVVAKQVAAQRATIEAERNALRGANKTLASTAEKIALQQAEREAAAAAAKAEMAAAAKSTAWGYKAAGNALKGGAMAVFALWDSVDAINDLFE